MGALLKSIALCKRAAIVQTDRASCSISYDILAWSFYRIVHEAMNVNDCFVRRRALAFRVLYNVERNHGCDR